MAQKAIEARPNDYRYRGTLAEIYASLSDDKAQVAYDEAIRLAQSQLAIHPENGEVWSDLAVYQAKKKTKNKEDALASIEKALKFAPNQWDVTQNALIVYETTGNRPQALGVLKDAVKRHQDVGMIRNNPALAEFCKDPSCQRLLESQPGDEKSAKARG